MTPVAVLSGCCVSEATNEAISVFFMPPRIRRAGRGNKMKGFSGLQGDGREIPAPEAARTGNGDRAF
ncbi:hypothetical protein MPUCK001_36290 [Citrobacter koseri]|nr:hypothetical protein MPUCK001_36290 [Citrobacter koseri]